MKNKESDSWPNNYDIGSYFYFIFPISWIFFQNLEFSICCEAVLLHYIVNVYFLWRPVFTMLYPASNYFLSQFTQRDSWVLRIPLIRQMTPH